MVAPSPIELLSPIVPVSDEDAAGLFGTAGRERLCEAITDLPPTRARVARHRVRRPVVIGLAAVVVATATAAVAWAVSHGAARDDLDRVRDRRNKHGDRRDVRESGGRLCAE